MEKFRRSFPRNQLYTIAQDLAAGRLKEGKERGQKALAAAKIEKSVFDKLMGLLGGPSGGDERLCWLHIAELWDYTRVG